MVEKHRDFFREHPVSKETKKHPGNVLKKSALSANNRNKLKKKEISFFYQGANNEQTVIMCYNGLQEICKLLELIQALRFQKRLSQQSISYLNHD